MAVGNGGSVRLPPPYVDPRNPLGGNGKTGGGLDELEFSPRRFDSAGKFGSLGFFDPKMRDRNPGRFSAGGSSIIGLALGVLSLFRSPKMRLRIGRRLFSFGGSGKAPLPGIIPPAVAFRGLSRNVIVSPVFTSLSSVK